MFRTLLLSVLVISIAAPLAGLARAAGEVPAVVGTWKGSYLCAQGRTGATVTVEGKDSQHLTGEFSFYPLPGEDVPSGKYRLRVRYDEATGEVVLDPTDWIERPSGYSSIPLVGALSPDRNRMLGRVDHRSCGEFEFTRGGVAPAAAEAAKGEIKLSLGKQKTCRAFMAWTNRLEREYPGTDLRRMRASELYERAANLFSDEAMTEFIGKPFDRLTQHEREKVVSPALTYCTRRWEGRSAITWQDAMTRPFHLNRGSFSAEQVRDMVVRNRGERQWAREAAVTIEAAEPTVGGLAKLRRLHSSAKTEMAHLWPSERHSFDELAATRLKELALAVARTQLSNAPETAEGLKEVEATASDARRDGVGDMLVKNLSERRAEIREAIARTAGEKVSAMPDTIEGLQNVLLLRNVTVEKTGERVVALVFDPVVAAWANDAVSGIAGDFDARLREMPDTMAGVRQAGKLHDELGGAIGLLGDAAASRFEAAVIARQASMSEAVERQMRDAVSNYVPPSWRHLEVLPELVETAAISSGLDRASATTLASATEARIPELARELFPGFASELDDMGGWTGLAKLELARLRVERAASKRSGFAAYQDAVRDRRAILMAEVAVAERHKLDDWGETHEDAAPLLQAADELAASFEAIGETERANELVDAALVRAEFLAAHSLEPFLETLESLPDEVDGPPRLMEKAEEFVDLAGFAPSFQMYAEALQGRAIEMEIALCEPAYAATGLPPEVADVPLLAGEEPISVFRFACLLDRNGHALENMELDGDGVSVRMRIARNDGTTAIVLLHEIEFAEGSPVLSGFALGDLNRQEEISVAGWQDFSGEIARDRPSGLPDAEGVTICDRLAADPHDPRKNAEGVSLEVLDIGYAAEACLAAVEHDPNAHRLRYQLARVLMLSGDEENAGLLLQELAAEQYPAAQFGRAEMLILEQDGFDEAGELYRAAAAGGYLPAREQAALLAPSPSPEASAEIAPIAADSEPTEAEMQAAFSATTRSQYNCDIVLGCNVMGMMHIKLTRFEKHDCGSLGNSKQLCSYSGHISCSTSSGGIYDTLVCSNFGSFGPTEKVFLKTGTQWRLVE